MADEPRLPERAEQLLASFPVPERDWEAQARAIEVRLATTALGSTEAHWLEAPLPEEAPPAANAGGSDDQAANPTETPFPFDSMPSIMEAPASTPEGAAIPAAAVVGAASAEPVAAPAAAPAPVAATATPMPGAGSSQSLSALARSVAQKGGRPQSRDIARESLSVAAAARSHSDAMAERVRSARPVPPPPSQRPAPPSQRAPRALPVAVSPANNTQLGPWIAVGGIGVAAAVALWVFARPTAPTALPVAPEPAVAARAVPAQAEAPVAASRLAKEPGEAALAAAPTATAEGAAAPSVAASALPLAPRVAAASAPARAAEVTLGTPAPAAAPASKLAAADRPAPESIVLDDTATSGKGAAKAGAAPPQMAAGGLRPAAGSPSGGLPDRPSTGAVQAAVGSVMGAARSCVAGGVPTPAQVTFGSNGVVQAVTVSGPNAGTASASCIDAALRRARVAPFASPTFSLMVWVRP